MAFTAAAIGAALTALAVFVLPWAHYGDIEIPLGRFPGWPVYVASALALQAIVGWRLSRPDRWPRAALASLVGLMPVRTTRHQPIETFIKVDQT